MSRGVIGFAACAYIRERHHCLDVDRSYSRTAARKYRLLYVPHRLALALYRWQLISLQSNQGLRLL
jgi:hypothetical protein